MPFPRLELMTIHSDKSRTDTLDRSDMVPAREPTMHARPLSTDQACLKALGTVASSKQALLTHSIPNCQLFIFSLTLHSYPSIVGRLWLFCATLFFTTFLYWIEDDSCLLSQAPWPACASPPSKCHSLQR